MAYLTKSGSMVWNTTQKGLERKTTIAIERAINEKRPFTMLRNYYNPRHVAYNWKFGEKVA